MVGSSIESIFSCIWLVSARRSGLPVCGLERYHNGTSLYSIQIIGPRLHHLPTLFKMVCPVVRPSVRITYGMGKLMFDVIRTDVEHFVKNGSRHRPEAPAIGDFFTLQFTYDGQLPTSNYQVTVPLTMTSGTLTIPSYQHPTTLTHFYIYTVSSSTGLPTQWYVYMASIDPNGQGGGYPVWDILSSHTSSSGDQLGYSIEPGMVAYAGAYPSGTWTRTEVTPSVPLPATFLLFGSGLAGLVGYKKKIKK